MNVTSRILYLSPNGSGWGGSPAGAWEHHVWKAVSYTHLRAHETVLDLVCRLLLEKKKKKSIKIKKIIETYNKNIESSTKYKYSQKSQSPTQNYTLDINNMSPRDMLRILNIHKQTD